MSVPAPWRSGMRWRVEYLLTVAPEKKEAAIGLPPPERSVWLYEVDNIGMEYAGDRLLISEAAGNMRYEVTFTEPDRTLSRVARIKGADRETILDHRGRTAYFGWSQRYQVLFEWPLLACTLMEAEQTFQLNAGSRIHQSTRFVGENPAETVLSVEYAMGDGDREIRRCRQTWDALLPWWSTASLETEYRIGGRTATIVLIQGKLLGA